MTDEPANVAIPAKYALNNALRRMRTIWDENRIDYWAREIASMVKRRKVTGDGIRKAVGTIDPDIIVSLNCDAGSRLGRPSLTVDMVRMQPVTLIPRNSVRRHEREIIILRRDIITQRGQEIDVRSGPMGIALDRHAAERIYDRENCTHDQIVQRLRDDLGGLIRTVAFIRAVHLIKRLENRPEGSPLAAGEVSFVPMGEGALILEAMQVDSYTGIARRTLIRNPATRITTACADRLIMADAEPIAGNPASGLMLMTGVTYLSKDLLRLEQRDCLALIEDEMAAAAAIVDKAADMLGRVSMPHEQPVVLPTLPAPSPRIIQLMARNVGRNRSPGVWVGNAPPRRRPP